MSPSSSTLIFVSIALCAVIPIGYGIRCFQCQSKLDPSCGTTLAYPLPVGHVAEKYLIDCDSMDKSSLSETDKNGKASFCRKIVQDVEGETNIIRSCGIIKNDKDCYMTANPPTKSNVCQCWKDGCNGSSTTSANIFTLILSTLVAFFLLNQSL